MKHEVNTEFLSAYNGGEITGIRFEGGENVPVIDDYITMKLYDISADKFFSKKFKHVKHSVHTTNLDNGETMTIVQITIVNSMKRHIHIYDVSSGSEEKVAEVTTDAEDMQSFDEALASNGIMSMSSSLLRLDTSALKSIHDFIHKFYIIDGITYAETVRLNNESRFEFDYDTGDSHYHVLVKKHEED